MYLGLGLLYVGRGSRPEWHMAPRLHTGQRDLGDEHLYRRSGTGRGALLGFRIRTGSVIRAGGAQFLLFAFTYLWVGINRFLDVDGRGLGGYCLFVAMRSTGYIELSVR